MSKFDLPSALNGSEIAVIGMAGRFPGARNLEQFWRNLCDGAEAVSFFSDDELECAAIAPAALRDPAYVRAWAILDDVDLFDAAFFEFTPKEAEVMDPQHRIFLESCWEALENAGYRPDGGSRTIGVYAGSTASTYIVNLYLNPQVVDSVGTAQIGIGNNVDFLTSGVSYKLNLRGPSYTIQSACSTSLVAVHVACQALLDGECGMALAGGVSVRVPQRAGYYYQEGGIVSPDGHCRAFDRKAQGTIFGSGVGVVVLKRLEDALNDGDSIRAVIKGSAINNDGSLKVGFTAPSVDGQSAVIVEALANAGVEASTIGYVEAHGTGTTLGDPIEIRALTEAFRVTTGAKGFCPIGSLKTNVGHLDAAAGVAGLMKTILALENRRIPPSLHFDEPNPKIDFQNSPFYVNTALREWKRGDTPLRAGVSSLGIGGTNAHVVVEESPALAPSGPSRPWQLLILSAKTESALETITQNLSEHLRRNPQTNLADLAYTLQVGRKPFDYRRVLVASDVADAQSALASHDLERVRTAYVEPRFRPVAFMFPGQAAQYASMAAELYRSEVFFRRQVDRCAELMEPDLGFNLAERLLARADGAQEQIDQTSLTQPALFVIEYALAQTLMSWGVEPDALIGHSIGEYVAACLAGVFSLEDALRLVTARGRLMQGMTDGAMLAVPLAERDLRPLLGEGLCLAAVNAPSACVVSGPRQAVDAFAAQLSRQGITHHRLRTSHAFHSQMMDLALEPFLQEVKRVSLNPPRLPYLSNVTGAWAGDEVTQPSYWVKHLRETVRFADGVAELLKEPDRILLEVGPGQTLTSLAKQQGNAADGRVVIATMRHPQDKRSDVAHLLGAVGQLWTAGGMIDWESLYANERRRRLPLPTYPFERQRYWVEAKASVRAARAGAQILKRANIAEWFYVPSWKRSMRPALPEAAAAATDDWWLVFTDEAGVAAGLIKCLDRFNQNYVCVTAGERFSQVGDCDFTLDPARPADYEALVGSLLGSGHKPGRIIHLWTVAREADEKRPSAPDERVKERGFYSLLFLAQALGKANYIDPVKLWLISTGLHEVIGDERVIPEKALALGPCKVIPQEHTNIRCYNIDLALAPSEDFQAEALAQRLQAEFYTASPDPVVAYRGEHRWVQSFEPVRLESCANAAPRLRPGGVYLILGGLGRFGLLIAKYLAANFKARLILTGKTGLPERAGWGRRVAAGAGDDLVAGRMEKVRELEAFGAEVLVVGADLGDREQVQAAVDRAVARFGEIHGVIHAAGLQEHRSIQGVTREECERMFASKVDGLFALEQALKGRALDFCLLTSSLSPILGGLGFVCYSAANLFMDAFARHVNRAQRLPWMSINWEGWHRRDVEKGPAPESLGNFGAQLAGLVMSDEEVIECFQRALRLEGTPQLVIATGDIQLRINQWIKLESLEGGGAQKGQEPAAPAAGRPRQRREFVPPRDEIEHTIVEVGRSLLGIEDIGVYDNFFEMGGSSLLAVQLISRLREAFKQQIPLSALFEKPTVAGLAGVIRANQPGQEDLSEISRLLAEIEQLNDEEIERRLPAEMQKAAAETTGS